MSTEKNGTPSYIKKLKEIYKDGASLGIQYLFDDEVIPIEEYYVALALTEEVEQRSKENINLNNEKNSNNHFDFDETTELLSNAENFFIPQKNIDIQNIFDSNYSSNEHHRILIIGRAGVGKSTLCQFILSQWAAGKLWQERYQAIFRIPLRNLIANRYSEKNNCDISEIINRECFNSRLTKKEKKKLDEDLKDNPNNYLIILDGYDELSNEEKNQDLVNQIEPLLSYPEVLITSRPYAVSGFKADIKLEITGFSEEKIKEYIDNFFEEDEAKVKLKQYLKTQAITKSLAHIPLNLELICHAWKAEYSQWEENISLTDVYQKLVEWLQYRYLKKFHLDYNQPIKQQKLNDLNPAQIQKLCSDWLEALEIIAWKMHQTNSIYIAKDEIFPDKENRGKLLEQLRESGLLRLTVDKQFYYFIHLTFQEYFTACCCARVIKHSGSQGGEQFEGFLEFFRHNKFNPKLQISWWFVSGLLKNNQRSLGKFFNLLLANVNELTTMVGELPLFLNCLEQSGLPKNNLAVRRLFDWVNTKISIVLFSLNTFSGNNDVYQKQRVLKTIGQLPRVAVNLDFYEKNKLAIEDGDFNNLIGFESLLLCWEQRYIDVVFEENLCQLLLQFSYYGILSFGFLATLSVRLSKEKIIFAINLIDSVDFGLIYVRDVESLEKLLSYLSEIELEIIIGNLLKKNSTNHQYLFQIIFNFFWKKYSNNFDGDWLFKTFFKSVIKKSYTFLLSQQLLSEICKKFTLQECDELIEIGSSLLIIDIAFFKSLLAYLQDDHLNFLLSLLDNEEDFSKKFEFIIHLYRFLEEEKRRDIFEKICSHVERSTYEKVFVCKELLNCLIDEQKNKLLLLVNQKQKALVEKVKCDDIRREEEGERVVRLRLLYNLSIELKTADFYITTLFEFCRRVFFKLYTPKEKNTSIDLISKLLQVVSVEIVDQVLKLIMKEAEVSVEVVSLLAGHISKQNTIPLWNYFCKQLEVNKDSEEFVIQGLGALLPNLNYERIVALFEFLVYDKTSFGIGSREILDKIINEYLDISTIEKCKAIFGILTKIPNYDCEPVRRTFFEKVGVATALSLILDQSFDIVDEEKDAFSFGYSATSASSILVALNRSGLLNYICLTYSKKTQRIEWFDFRLGYQSVECSLERFKKFQLAYSNMLRKCYAQENLFKIEEEWELKLSVTDYQPINLLALESILLELDLYQGYEVNKQDDNRLLDKITFELTNINDISFEKAKLRKNLLAHINSFGNNEHQENLERCFPNEFLVLHIQNLLEILGNVKANFYKSDLQGKHTKEKFISLLKREILITVQALHWFELSRLAGDDQNLQTEVAKIIWNAIGDLSDGEELIYPTGYFQENEAHCVYVVFQRIENTLIVRVDNLGDGAAEYHRNHETQKNNKAIYQVKPCFLGCLDFENLKNENQDNKNFQGYLINIVAAIKFGRSEAFSRIYFESNISKEVINKFLQLYPAKKQQIVNNCVVRNFFVGSHIRLGKELHGLFRKWESALLISKAELVAQIGVFAEANQSNQVYSPNDINVAEKLSNVFGG